MKNAIWMCLALVACTAEAPIAPDAAPPMPDGPRFPEGNPSCQVSIVGPYQAPTSDGGISCWSQVTVDVRCQKYVEQRPRRIEMWWYAGQAPYGGGYVQTMFECDRLTTAIFYDSTCGRMDQPIVGGGRFQDPTTDVLNETSPKCETTATPQLVGGMPRIVEPPQMFVPVAALAN